ncbi:MAG: substrate-binding domain-containing protein [Spirochaetales bacterium]|nr:substrate-binding domain-containing protein [Spirochaetales bacterium]
MQTTRNRRKRRTIALFIDWLSTPYHLNITSGVIDSAVVHDVNLLIFVGGHLYSPRKYELPRNLIYSYATRESVDGIIMSSGSMSIFCGNERFADFCREFSDLPIVSISHYLENKCSIMVENTKGFYDLFDHLIEHHHCRNIAYISGPDGITDSDERLAVYKGALEKYNIPFNPDLVVKGNFMVSSADSALKTLLDERDVKFDALVGANDNMALKALDLLLERGYRVPEDVLVAGFDDTDLSRLRKPSLTTVRQQFYVMGQYAVENMVAILDGKKVEEKQYVPTQLIIRESCGCANTPYGYVQKTKEVNSAVNMDKNGKGLTLKQILSAHEDAVINETKARLSAKISNLPDFVVETFIRQFFMALFDGKLDSFMKKFDDVAEKTLFIQQKVTIWQDALTIIRNHLLRANEYPNIHNNISDMVDAARCFIIDYNQKLEDLWSVQSKERVYAYDEITMFPIENPTFDELIKNLAENIPGIGFKGFYFTLYENNNLNTIMDSHSILELAYDSKRFPVPVRENILYPTKKLLPDGFFPEDRSYQMVIEPLYFESEHYGLTFFEADVHKDMYLLFSYRTFMNNALNAYIFVRQLQGNASQISLANNELKQALDNLKFTQQELIQSEKMAALGGLVAGVAHEINTPVGIGVTAISHLQKMTGEIFEIYKKDGMKRSDFEKYTDSVKEISAIVLANLKRASDLIRSFKNISVDQSTEEKRSFNVKEYVHDVLLSLQPKLKKTNHRITIECPDNLVLLSYPGAFSQIITNLVMNSLSHAFSEIDQGEISFSFAVLDTDLFFTYTDNGMGIEKKYVDKIFNPFFTTKRNEGGTGLGLHLVYNIVNQTLSGHIYCKSEPGKGTTFVIILPLNVLEPNTDKNLGTS